MSVTPTPTVLANIDEERANQIAQWGGDIHDDLHGPHDWLDYIQHQVNKGREAFPRFLGAGRRVEWRSRMIKIAALAIAAAESHDRLKAHDDAVEAAEANSGQS